VTEGVQFAEQVSACRGGAVVRADVGELAATLDAWLSDSARRARAGEAGKKYIQENLTWRRTAEQLAALYHRICRERRSAESRT
jgi:glycosyltransferase involved in cell wall biosynthesis